MRKIVHATVLTTFSTLLGLIPLAVSAQIAPNQVEICSSLPDKATFKLNGKGEELKPTQCRTFSGSSPTFLFYTEYGDGTGERYSLERRLPGGMRYKFEQTQAKPKRLNVTPAPIKPT